MRILYCRIGWMNSYRGHLTERPEGGGKYNETNIGHEVYNYRGVDGRYYGFVEAGVNNTIHVEKLCEDRNADFADDIYAVWVAKKPEGGQYIVGWYCNARVYRRLQTVPDDVMSERELKDHYSYNVFSRDVLLIAPEDRKYKIDKMGHSNIWYGDEETDKAVCSYIQGLNSEYEERIEKIENDASYILGGEKETIVKARVNQDKFRQGLISKFGGRCCLCGVNNPAMLFASHIKPWAKSDNYEKLDLNNGLLLCPNHDKLFDSGYISFDNQGVILVSDKLDDNNRIFMNIRATMRISITEDNADYFKYHRDNIFIDRNER